MKGYRTFIIVFSVLFIVYLIAELNKPEPVDWTVTLSSADKNPYGGFIVYNQLKHVFPNAVIKSNKTSIYQQINNTEETKTAYIIMGDAYRPTSTTTTKLKKYVSKGNYVIMSANWFYTPFLDSLGAEIETFLALKPGGSTSVNFVNPKLQSAKSYTFIKGTIDNHFSKIDTTKAIVISTNNKGKPVYIKLALGKGAFLIHADPICFSNYFLLFRDNASYASKALSYLPADISKVYWDEHEKLAPGEPQTPLRFFLSNEYLRWALRLSVIGMIVYVLFEMKRRQRIIPVVEPSKNSTLDFVKTVAGVYFNERNNKDIATQKVSYFLEFIRNRFGLSTGELNEDFIKQLHRKSGLDKDEITNLISIITSVSAQTNVTDAMLLNLNRNIDNFYNEVR